MFDEEPFYCAETGLYSQETCLINDWDGWMPAAGFTKYIAGQEFIGGSCISVSDFLDRVLQSAYTVAKFGGRSQNDLQLGLTFGENLYVAYVGGHLPTCQVDLYLAWKLDNTATTYFVGRQPISSDLIIYGQDLSQAPVL